VDKDSRLPIIKTYKALHGNNLEHEKGIRQKGIYGISLKNFLSLQFWSNKISFELIKIGNSLLFIVFLLLPLVAEARNFYVNNTCTYNGDGTTQDCATGEGHSGPFNSIGKAQKELNGDQSNNHLLLRRGQIFREQFTISGYGTENHPFDIGDYGTGNIPIISGADLFNRGLDWTREGVTIGTDNLTGAKLLWYLKVKTDPEQIFINGTRTIRVLSKRELDKENKWYFDRENGRVYVYCASNPSNLLIEVPSRSYGVEIKDKKFLKFKNIQVEKTKGDGFRVEGDSHYITLEKVVAKENYNTGMDVNCAGYTCTGGKVQDSIFMLNGGSGLKLSYAANWTISQNKLTNNCQLKTGKDAHTFAAGIKMTATNSANNILERNISSGNTNGCGIWLDFCGGGNIIRYNKTCGNGSAGIFNEITSGTEIYYNISCKNIGRSEASGIYIEGRKGLAPKGGPATNVKVYNNVLFANDKFGLIIQNGDGVRGNCYGNIIKNNIIVNTGNGPNLRVGGAAEQEKNIIENNCFGNESLNFIEWGWGKYKSSYAGWEAAYGSLTNSIKADPQMVDPSKDGFRLKPTSPCIGAGTDVGLSRDHAGVDLIKGSPPDVGAYRYSIKK
jgi:hypothetical protein